MPKNKMEVDVTVLIYAFFFRTSKSHNLMSNDFI